MKTPFKTAATTFALLVCWLALAGPAQAGANGTPGAREARPAGALTQSGRGKEPAASEASMGHWRGTRMTELTKDWWHWWMSIPANVHPSFDDGTNCGINQEGPVWYLAGPLNPNFSRTCTIPHGKAILSPIAAFIDDYPCPNPAFQPAAGQTLEVFLTEDVTPLIDQTRGQAILDGVLLKAPRITTRLFGFTGAASLSEKADPCVTGSPQVGVSDGYFFIIDPLSRGDHVLQITSNGPGGASNGTFTLKIR